MTTRKHNEFLDIAPSDEDSADDRGYDSEENVAKSKGRAVKRQRTANTQDFFGLQSDDESADEEDKGQTEVKGKTGKQSKSERPASDDEDEDEDENDEDGGALLDTTKPVKSVKPLSTKPLKEPKKNKTGVVYLSSLPPYLKPFALKNMLEQRGFSPITKVFLSPLVPSNSGPQRRLSKRKRYTDGWLEFKSV
jgi:ESF2/ABP1 family protein